MKKTLTLLLLLVVWTQTGFAQATTFRTMKECLQHFQMGVASNAGTTILRNSQGVSADQITQYLKEWRANRCLNRAIAVASENDVQYNELANDYRMVVKLPAGWAYFLFNTNSSGYFRFTGYTKEGNVNSCPPAKEENNSNLYASIDLIGTWNFKETAWTEIPGSYKSYLEANGYTEDNIQYTLNEKLKNVNWDFLLSLKTIVFRPDKTGKFIASSGEYNFSWKLSYNQLIVTYSDGTSFPFPFRLDPYGNFNALDRGKDNDGEIAFVYQKL
jgi:hypothetical protein